MKRSISAVAGLAATALLLTACAGGTGSGAGGSDEPHRLAIGNFMDVNSWDPSQAEVGFDGPYLSAVYDALVGLDGDGEPVPELATDWEFSEDFTILTMNLRDDVVFSDGAEFDADAAVKGLEFLKEGITSHDAYLQVESFDAVDDYTVAINLKQRDDSLLYYMGLGRSFMVSPDAIDGDTLAETPVGSGPYTLSDSSIPGAEYHFDKVEDHWSGDLYPFEPLEIYPLSDFNALLNGMEAGQLDVIYTDTTGMNMAEDQGWNQAEGLATWVGLQFADRAGETEMGEPFGDVRVRQALNYAFDSKEIFDQIGRGEGQQTNQVFRAGNPGYDPSLDDMYEYNMDRAKELMAEAGYADGFALTMPMSPQFQPYQAIVEQTFGELGIDLTWKETDFVQYMSVAGDYPVFIGVIKIESNPVATIERHVTTPVWYNPTPGVESFPEVMEQLDRVYTAEPGDAQTAEIEEFNRMVTEEAFFSVWYQASNMYVSDGDIELTPVTGMMFPQLRHISLAG